MSDWWVVVTGSGYLVTLILSGDTPLTFPFFSQYLSQFHLFMSYTVWGISAAMGVIAGYVTFQVVGRRAVPLFVSDHSWARLSPLKGIFQPRRQDLMLAVEISAHQHPKVDICTKRGMHAYWPPLTSGGGGDCGGVKSQNGWLQFQSHQWIYLRTPGDFYELFFVVTKPGVFTVDYSSQEVIQPPSVAQNSFFKTNHDVFQTLTKLVLSFNLTRA